MPIYEYEPEDRECLMCDGRIDVMQAVGEEPLKYCPSCGLEVRRIISRMSFSTRTGPSADKAAERGFTTWRKSGLGTWEKVAGSGADVLAGSPEDIQTIHDEAKKISRIDFDSERP